MSNPANRLPPEYDEMQPQDYDPQFTADINTKMRVPDRIGGVTDEGLYGRDALRNSDLRRSANMCIPDKIVVLGTKTEPVFEKYFKFFFLDGPWYVLMFMIVQHCMFKNNIF